MKVNSLTHMVVVVDENSGESATAALEEQLQVSRQAESLWEFVSLRWRDFHQHMQYITYNSGIVIIVFFLK